MADPISITGLILTIVPILVRYAADVSDSKKAIKALTMEIMATKGILEQIEIQRQIYNQEPESSAAAKYSSKEFSDLLKLAEGCFASLNKALKPVSTPFGLPIERVTWPFKQEEIQKQIDLIERVKSGLFAVLTTDNMVQTRNILAEVSHIKQMMEMERDEKKIEKSELERDTFLKWLAPASLEAMRSKHKKIFETHLEGTNDWFVKKTLDDFLGESAERASILWLRGKSGAGKTVLLSNVIEHLSRYVAPSDVFPLDNEALSPVPAQASGLAYFYCSFDDSATHVPRNILGSFVAQLASKLPQMAEKCLEKFKESQNKGFSSDVSVSDLLDIFVQRVNALGKLFICIDAVNESAQRNKVEQLLLKLASKCKNLRIIVTSVAGCSKEEERNDVFSLRQVVMHAGDVDRDIERYVANAVTEDEVLRSFSNHTKNKITANVPKKANGMFRYAQLQIENLANQMTERYAEEALEDLPEDLNDCYVRILESIPSKSRDRGLVQRALLWMSFVARPIDIFALADAVVLEDQDRGLDARSRLPSAMVLVQIARGLLELDSSTMLVSLSHFSVKAFLTTDFVTKSSVADFALSESIAHKTLMRSCLTYLSFEQFSQGPGSFERMRYNLASYPLLMYAGEHWVYHFRTETREDWNLIQRFLESRQLRGGGNYAWWITCTAGGMLPAEVIEQSSPLYYAASFGQVNLVKAIIENNKTEDLEASGGRQGSTALQVACFRRHKETARALIEAGANPFSLDGTPIGQGLSAFFWANLNGWEDIKTLMAQITSATRPTVFEGSTDPEILSYIRKVQDDAFARTKQDLSVTSKPNRIWHIVPTYRLDMEILRAYLKEKFGEEEVELGFPRDSYRYAAPRMLTLVGTGQI